MRTFILAIFILAIVLAAVSASPAHAQGVPPAGAHDQTLTGNNSTAAPLGVRVKTGGGLTTNAGVGGLSLLSTCTTDQVLAFRAGAWGCADGGGMAAGTFKHLSMFTPDGHHIGDSPLTFDTAPTGTLTASGTLTAPVYQVNLGGGEPAGNPTYTTTATDNGAGVLSAGAYKWAYYEEDVVLAKSTGLSPASSPLTLAASHSAFVTTGQNRRGMAGRVLCRTKAGGSIYYAVHNFGGGADFFDTMWVDNVADSALVTPCPTVDTTAVYGLQVTNDGVHWYRTHPNHVGPADSSSLTGDPLVPGTYSEDHYATGVWRTINGTNIEAIKTGTSGYGTIGVFWTGTGLDTGAGFDGGNTLTQVFYVGDKGSTSITPGVLPNAPITSSDVYGLSVTATLATTATVAHSGVNFDITSAGSSAFAQRAVSVQLEAGYTGSSDTAAGVASNATATTGTAYGYEGGATGTAAQNIGLGGKAANGTRNFGLYGGFADAPTGATGGRDVAVWADNQATTSDLFMGTDSRSGHVIAFEVRADGGIFGSSTGVYLSSDGALGYQAGTNGTATGYINFYGYAPANVPGTTQFRNLIVADGKGATIATITGSTKAADFAGALDGLTVATGGASGSKWSKSTGAPAISCSIGDIFSRTDGGVGTSLYLCTASNTWTADGTSGSTGTVTSIATSSGITGGTITTTGTIGYDSTVIQSRVTGTCTAPNAIRAIASDGSVTCTTGTGSVTSVATGTGLTGGTITSTGTISLNINAGSTQTCGAGTAVTALTGVGITSCSTFSTLTNGAGNNVIPKSNGTNLVASSLSDDATTVSTTEAVSVGTATGKGKFSVLSGNPGASGGTVIANGVWDTNYTILGPNVASTTGAALAFAYSTTDSASKIMSLAPGNAWERLDLMASQHNWYVNNSLKMTLDGTTLALTGAETISSTLGVTGQISGSASLAITGFVSWTTQLADGGTVFTLASGTTTNTKGVSSGTFTSSGTTETITFGGGFTFSSTPSCVVTAQTVAGKGFAYSVSTTAITLSSLTTATKYDFACRGHQ